jgi:hypothetical protein
MPAHKDGKRIVIMKNGHAPCRTLSTNDLGTISGCGDLHVDHPHVAQLLILYEP